jgi:hypothetical protein
VVRRPTVWSVSQLSGENNPAASDTIAPARD